MQKEWGKVISALNDLRDDLYENLEDIVGKAATTVSILEMGELAPNPKVRLASCFSYGNECSRRISGSAGGLPTKSKQQVSAISRKLKVLKRKSYSYDILWKRNKKMTKVWIEQKLAKVLIDFPLDPDTNFILLENFQLSRRRKRFSLKNGIFRKGRTHQADMKKKVKRTTQPKSKLGLTVQPTTDELENNRQTSAGIPTFLLLSGPIRKRIVPLGREYLNRTNPPLWISLLRNKAIRIRLGHCRVADVVNVDIPDNMKVAELLSDEGIWDGVRLLHYFGAPLATIIAQIPIEASLPRDKIELIKSSIGSTITTVNYSWQFEDCEDPVSVIYKLDDALCQLILSPLSQSRQSTSIILLPLGVDREPGSDVEDRLPRATNEPRNKLEEDNGNLAWSNLYRQDESKISIFRDAKESLNSITRLPNTILKNLINPYELKATKKTPLMETSQGPILYKDVVREVGALMTKVEPNTLIVKSLKFTVQSCPSAIAKPEPKRNCETSETRPLAYLLP
ncbi:hypothetical protein M5K25_027657 [Dendrobium thyrsiflorum]|uniref:Uncharacterized protein n=1 Tax=Dendrobium thyrsiflorum TaxID=117978 RepID=A0ABD0TUI4_DENTH